MHKKLNGRSLAAMAVAAMTSALAAPAHAERFELTFTGTLTRMQSYIGCEGFQENCVSHQDLTPVAPVTFSRSIVFEVGGSGMGDPYLSTNGVATDWYGRPMEYTMASQTMGHLERGTAETTSILPGALLDPGHPGAASGAPTAGWASPFHTRDIMTYLDGSPTVRSDLWGVVDIWDWTPADGRHVSGGTELMHVMPYPVTFENMAAPMTVSQFIARMNQDFWCSGCTQTVLSWATVYEGGKSNDYLYHGTASAFSLRQLDATAVPEPSTYALMLAGVAVIGVMARRKRAIRS